MPWTENLITIAEATVHGTRYEAVATALERAILSGQLQNGERLPTVRQLSDDLGISPTTVNAAYKTLRRKGLISSEVGRGTFVHPASPSKVNVSPVPAQPVPSSTPGGPAFRGRVRVSAPWRKRALASSASFLRSAYAEAMDCSSGRPDPDLLPRDVLATAWQGVFETVEPVDLQYVAAETLPRLTSVVLPRLTADSIDAEPDNLLVGSSAQQLMMLAFEVMAATAGNGTPMVAVEEPGYPTIFDSFERAGAQLIGFDVDRFGAKPDSLEQALAAGATIVLLTPRAHNPTGASWSVERRKDLADVIAAYDHVFAIEDDQFAGLARARAGSLFNDERIAERVFYIRSFSKSIAPDLRIAVGVARPRMRSLLAEAKTFADGWTSRLIQRVLANVLVDPALDQALSHAAAAYAQRRDALTEALATGLARSGGAVWPHSDGVNVWVDLPPGREAFEIVEQAASLGVITAPGEPFFIRPGRGQVLRINAGAVDASRAAEAGRALVKAATMVSGHAAIPMV